MLKDLISMFFPHYCFTCHNGLLKGEKYFCAHCIYNFPKAVHELDKNNSLAMKFHGKIPIRYALAYLKFQKRGSVQTILHKLKYENFPDIGLELGKMYGTYLKSQGFSDKFDLILPIPLHESKSKLRGYNQTHGFADGLSIALDVPWNSNILHRRIDNESQTRKSKYLRWKNVAGIFDVENEAYLKDKRILLVDDVITTGSTVESCSQKLLNAGIKELSIGTIAEAK